jgi:hypothetical protein
MLRRTRVTAAALCSVAALAVAVIACGAAYAASAAKSRTITVCVHHNGGGLYRAARCDAHDSRLTWNAQGPAGPRGPAGAKGLSLFARVDQAGTLHQHSAGVTVTKDKTFTGVYHVFFAQNISRCAAVVSQGEAANNSFFPGTLYEAVVQSDPNNDGNPHEVAVFPTDPSGVPRDAGFDLILAC